MARTNLQYARNFNPYAKDVTIEELQRVRRQLAKVMKQRMKRLETNKSTITGESYTFGAYDLMSDYLRDHGTSGKKKRFKEVLAPQGMDEKALQKEIRILQGFEELKSSQISGMHEIERKRIETLTGDEGATKALHEEIVTTKDFYDFLNSSTYDEITKDFDSEKLVEEYDRYAAQGATKEDIVTALTKYVEDLKPRQKPSIKGIKKALGAIKIK